MTTTPLRKKLDLDLVAKMYRQGWTVRGLAAHFSYSYGSIHKALAKAGVQMRRPGGARVRKRPAGKAA